MRRAVLTARRRGSGGRVPDVRAGPSTALGDRKPYGVGQPARCPGRS
ncbi:hypothetical protein GZL_01526 [Streptomyces sp. 769]|nr:hypothetical protein GZL_01526 [Streptomyces sp. 769]